MSYSIKDIKSTTPQPIPYFFDANVWLIIINASSTPNKDHEAYITFFDAVCTLRTTLIGMKKNKVLPSIIASPMLISEVFNSYMRIAFSKWKDEMVNTGKLNKAEADAKEYKKHYRKELHFDNAVKQFKSDFLAYTEYITLMDDVAKVDPFDILKNFPTNTDFNDVYMYTFCYENKISFVTHDGDFLFQDVDIITNNKNLLKHI